MPALHPDENQEYELFKPFENRFQKAKPRERTALKAELQRLGAPVVTEILARCAQRGRSWQYVLRALANESPSSAPSRAGESATCALPDPQEVLEMWQSAHAEEEAERAAQAALPTSERVHLEVGELTAATVWTAAKQQLELQIERSTFETWLQASVLVDF